MTSGTRWPTERAVTGAPSITWPFMRKVAIVVATLLAAAFGGPPQATAEPTGFDLQAHRGGRGETTEESLRAFAKSLELRVSTLEDPGFALVADGVFNERAHALGLKVIPWTINDPDAMRAQIAAGADGIITDYPSRLRAVMRELGMPLPPPYRTS